MVQNRTPKADSLASAILLIANREISDVEGAIDIYGDDVERVLQALNISYTVISGEQWIKKYYPASFKGKSITPHHIDRFNQWWEHASNWNMLGESKNSIFAIVKREFQTTAPNPSKSARIETLYKLNGHGDNTVHQSLEAVVDTPDRKFSNDAYSYVAWALDELSRKNYQNARDYLVIALKK